MPNHRGLVREVAWSEIFPWLLLFRTFRLARDPRKLVMAAAALVLTAAGWSLIDRILGPAPLVPGVAGVAIEEPWPWNEPGMVAQSVRISSAAQGVLGATHLDIPWSQTRLAAERNWLWLTGPFRQLIDPRQPLANQSRVAALGQAILSSLWALVVWSMCAGAITRIAAVELGLEERLSWNASLRYAASNWRGYLGAPLLPFAFLVILAVPMYVLGLLIRLADAGYLLAGLAWPLVLMAAIVMALVMIGLLLGWPLLFTAVSVDGADGFDAFSRTYTYVFQRPFHYAFYLIVSGLFGLASWIVSATFAAVVLWAAGWGVAWGSGLDRAALAGLAGSLAPVGLPSVTQAPAAELSTAGQWGLGLFGFWASCVRLIVMSFAYSFFWTAWTAMYLLLRRDADAAELDDVLMEDRPDPHELPKLRPDAAGVPVLADPPSSATAPAEEKPT